jgi:hypothetical protein
MYTIILYEGTVTRNEDGKVVAPCQSDQDPDFRAYIDWVEAGNQPAIVQYALKTTSRCKKVQDIFSTCL